MSSARDETRPVVEAGDTTGDEYVSNMGTDMSPIKDNIKQQTEINKFKQENPDSPIKFTVYLMATMGNAITKSKKVVP